jgi:hypothetical protein
LSSFIEFSNISSFVSFVPRFSISRVLNNLTFAYHIPYMIKIERNEKLTILYSTVTDFADSMGYCEHKIPFYMEGIKVPTLQTIQGAKAHQEEEKIEKEKFVMVPITEEELVDISKDVEFAREKIFTRLLLPLAIGNENVVLLLHGRADKVLRNGQTLIVQDDKFPYNIKKYDERFEPFDDQKLQALAYLNSKFSDDGSLDPKYWFDIPHKEKAWIIQIRDRNNGNKPYRIFKGIQNEHAFTFLSSAIKRFASLVLDIEEKRHHNVPAKCKPCGYFEKCQFRL